MPRGEALSLMPRTVAAKSADDLQWELSNLLKYQVKINKVGSLGLHSICAEFVLARDKQNNGPEEKLEL